MKLYRYQNGNITEATVPYYYCNVNVLNFQRKKIDNSLSEKERDTIEGQIENFQPVPLFDRPTKAVMASPLTTIKRHLLL
jgi:hypothetical protein